MTASLSFLCCNTCPIATLPVGSVAIGQISEGKCCDWTNIGREVLPIGQISEGKCCDWTIIGREVLRLDNYLKGSVAIGQSQHFPLDNCPITTLPFVISLLQHLSNRNTSPSDNISNRNTSLQLFVQIATLRTGSVAIGQVLQQRND